MKTWLAANAVRIAIALIAIIALWWLVSSWFSGQSAKTEAKLGRNTTEAAIESGRDAVNAIGEQGAAEDATDRITTENTDDILNAEGADAPVAAGARAAGLRSLCKRAAYRERVECMQFTPAGGVEGGRGGGTPARR